MFECVLSRIFKIVLFRNGYHDNTKPSTTTPDFSSWFVVRSSWLWSVQSFIKFLFQIQLRAYTFKDSVIEPVLYRRSREGDKYTLSLLLMHRGWVWGWNLVVRPLMFYWARPIEKLPWGRGGHRCSLNIRGTYVFVDAQGLGWGWELGGQTSNIWLSPSYRKAPGDGRGAQMLT